MRKFSVFPVMPVFLLALGLAFVSCDNGTTSGGGGTTVPGSNLAGKLAWLQDNAESSGSYLIELDADESTPTIVIGGRGTNMAGVRENYVPVMSAGAVFVDFGNRAGITVTLKGRGGNRNISLAPNLEYGPLFSVFAGVTLVLDNNITLKRRPGLETTMIYVIGTLVMNSGSAIDDTDAVEFGGGVRVHGTFTMNGGTIFGGGWFGVVMEQTGVFTMNGGTIRGRSGNGVSVGGVFTMNSGTISGNGMGVYVKEVTRTPAGTFIMNGGVIRDHTSEYGGAGVSVGADATFTMSGGTITGNTALFGAGVLCASGTFTKTGGTITGSNSSGGNTATQSNGGNAVYAGIFVGWDNGGYTNIKRKETTSSPSNNLSFNAGTGAFTGAWDE